MKAILIVLILILVGCLIAAILTMKKWKLRAQIAECRLASNRLANNSALESRLDMALSLVEDLRNRNELARAFLKNGKALDALRALRVD